MSLRIKLFLILTVLLVFLSDVYLYAQNDSKIDSLKQGIRTASSETIKIDLMLSLAEEYLTQIPDTAISISENTMLMADSISYNIGQYRSRRILAQAFSGVSRFKQALTYANEANVFLQEIDDPQERVKILSVYGIVFSEFGDYEKSAEYYFQALKICEEVQEPNCISTSYNSIGHLFFDQGNLDKALKYYIKSLEIAREQNDQKGIARGLNNLAIVYSENKDYTNVKKHLFEAITINQHSGMRLWEGINYLNLGTIFREQAIYDSSIFYYQKASYVFEELHHYRLIVNNNISISKYYQLTDSLDKAVKFGLEAFQIAEERELIIVENQAAKQLYDVFTDIGNQEEAFHYGLIHFQLKDSLELEKSATKLAQIELIYEFDKLNQQKKIEEQRKENNYILALISLFFIGVIIVVLLMTRHRLKVKNSIMAKKELEAEIEIKDKELTLNVMSLLKKNEVLANIVDKLMGVHDSAVKEETKTALLQIAKDIQKSSEEEIWEEFEVRFKQAHGDYYERLTKNFPNLSPNELKLCAFLKLNMSTKDISELTGQSIGALEIARTRLRKKLGITNTKANLVSFISQI
jgi:tetratricopeptide (TPR) repeat protein